MIDTVRFRIPITTHEKKLVEQIGRRTESYDVSTNHVYYSFTNTNLKGSWETTIQLKVQERVMQDKNCFYMLYVECSLHKLILGHNCFGGSDDLYSQLVYLQDVIFQELKIWLELKQITITRIDYAYVYKLQNQQQSINYIKQFHTVPYRGKTPEKYKTSVFWTFQDWSMKIYDKLSDFKVHDMKKIKFTKSFYDRLPGILRFEVTIRKKGLENLHKKKNLELEDINMDLIKKYADDKIKYLEKYIGDKTEHKRLTTYEQVMDRLYNSDTLKKGMASRLLTSYSMVSNVGLNGLKDYLTKSTYHRHKNMLMDHGIDIVNSTVKKQMDYIQKLYPEDFKMSDDTYKITNDDIHNYLQII